MQNENNVQLNANISLICNTLTEQIVFNVTDAFLFIRVKVKISNESFKIMKTLTYKPVLLTSFTHYLGFIGHIIQ